MAPSEETGLRWAVRVVAVAFTAACAATALAALAGAAPPPRSTKAATPEASASGGSAAAARRAPHRTVLALSAVTPRAGAHGVGAAAPIVLTFSRPLSATTPLPSLSPTTDGSWSVAGTRITFDPSVPFVPLSDVTLTIPGGTHGVEAADGTRLPRGQKEVFHIQDGSTLRLQQLMSILAYSPLTFHPTGKPVPDGSVAAQLRAMYSPPAGTFSWTDKGWPSELTSLWKQGRYNVFTRGLVMEFQADAELIANGHRNPGLWNDLLHAVTTGYRNTGGYDYALGNQQRPQSLTIWHDGAVVLKAPANTGIAASPTPDGNFNVYARYRAEVMHGTNPDGQHYADPVQYVAYFHGGDAVHYLPRAYYGIPQSLGCIELDLADAAKAWNYLAYGTIVSVIG